MPVSPIPNPHQPLAPYLIVQDADAAIAFYKRAFGAQERFRLVDPSGKVGHAEVDVAGGLVMVADEHPDEGALSPPSIGGTPVTLHLYVADIDAVVASALAAGATLLRPLTDEFFGDRIALVVDPFGHKWHLATRKEDVSLDELQRRMAAAYA